MSKGSKRRPGDDDANRANYERVFGKKDPESIEKLLEKNNEKFGPALKKMADDEKGSNSDDRRTKEQG